jgi:phosphoglycerate dehydrogenase-like enzyme
LIVPQERSSNLGSTGPDEQLFEADVAFGQPDPDQLIGATRLKWIHLTSAGYTRYDREDIRAALRERGGLLTNSSSVYDEPCAQHLLAFILAQVRELPRCLRAQFGLEGWINEKTRNSTHILRGQTVLILGYGAIARRLAELLEPFNLNIVAVRRAVRGDESIVVRPVGELHALLRAADFVVNALPSNPTTDGLLGAHEFSLMKAGAYLFNVGRGTTVDQDALMAALKSGRLAGAYLDVTDPEPLPVDHPLWATPNCYITPHIGGGYLGEYEDIVTHFLRNLRRFEAGQALADRVL